MFRARSPECIPIARPVGNCASGACTIGHRTSERVGLFGFLLMPCVDCALDVANA